MVNNQSYSTVNNQITAPLVPGNNRILISTDKACQGIVEKNINLSENVLFFPNPFEHTFNILFKNGQIAKSNVTVFTLKGKKVFAVTCSTTDAIGLGLTALHSGFYILRLSAKKMKRYLKL